MPPIIAPIPVMFASLVNAPKSPPIVAPIAPPTAPITIKLTSPAKVSTVTLAKVNTMLIYLHNYMGERGIYMPFSILNYT